MLRGQRVHRASKVTLARLAQPAIRAQQDLPDLQGLLVLLARLALQEIPARQALLDRQGRKALLDLLVLQEPRVLLVTPARQVQLV